MNAIISNGGIILSKDGNCDINKEATYDRFVGFNRILNAIYQSKSGLSLVINMKHLFNGPDGDNISDMFLYKITAGEHQQLIVYQVGYETESLLVVNIES